MTEEIKDLIALGSGMIMGLLWLASLISAFFALSAYFAGKDEFKSVLPLDQSALFLWQRRTTRRWITAYVLLGMSMGFLFLCLFFQSSG
jgi:hypothetical protein